MSSLMICSFFLLFLGQDHRAPFRSHHYFIFSILEIDHCYYRSTYPRRRQGRFVHKVCQISPRKPRRSPCYQSEINIRPQRCFLRMYIKDFFAAFNVRIWYIHCSVKSTWTKQSWIKNIPPVSSR